MCQLLTNNRHDAGLGLVGSNCRQYWRSDNEVDTVCPATTFGVPRRILVRYYDADLSKKFARSIEKDILPASISE
jgi:uncharacterized protein YbbK (DUF523 family)